MRKTESLDDLERMLDQKYPVFRSPNIVDEFDRQGIVPMLSSELVKLDLATPEQTQQIESGETDGQ